MQSFMKVWSQRGLWIQVDLKQEPEQRLKAKRSFPVVVSSCHELFSNSVMGPKSPRHQNITEIFTSLYPAT